MRRIAIILMFLSTVCFAQLPESVKHVELVSEVQDTMVLINHKDLDKINTTFYRLEQYKVLDSLNRDIILQQNLKTSELENILDEQKYIIVNKDRQLESIKNEYKTTVADLQKQIK